ncbi:glycosyltransferase [Formicincola oecophyllae]|nr:glycosyltransferase [Formicincola oecophyllae]
MTVHDLIPLLQPELVGHKPNELQRILEAHLKAGTCFVTVSEAVKKDMLAAFPSLQEGDLKVWQPPFPLSAADEEARKKAPSPFPGGGFVFCGSMTPRKNLSRLIEAHGRSGTERILHLVGPDGWKAAEALKAWANHPHPERVKRHSWLSRGQLLRAVEEACALVFPSLAEGYGYPIVEAMALGTPVVTSSHHACSETAGDGALLVRAHSVPDLTQALVALEAQPLLRAELTERGRRRALKLQDVSRWQEKAYLEWLHGLRASHAS